MNRKMGIKYESNPIKYYCQPALKEVELIAFYELQTDMGMDGGLHPTCGDVYCEKAVNCKHLDINRCPLETGFGDELNKLEVVVLKGEPTYMIDANNNKVVNEKEPVKPNGQIIWFGKTNTHRFKIKKLVNK